MEEKRLERGDILLKKGEKTDRIVYIKSGSVVLSGDFIKTPLEKGDIAGIIDIESETYMFDYIVEEDTDVCIFEYDGSVNSVENMMKISGKYRNLAINSSFNQLENITDLHEALDSVTSKVFDYIKSFYEEYKKLCQDYMMKPYVLKEIEQLEYFENDLNPDEKTIKYFQSLFCMSEKISQPFFAEDEDVMGYHLSLAADLAKNAVASSEKSYIFYERIFKHLYDKGAANIFTLYSKLALDVLAADGDISRIMKDLDKLNSLIKECKDMEEETLGLDFKYDYSRINDIYKLIRKKQKISDNKVEEESAEELIFTYSDAQITAAVEETKNALKRILEYSEIGEEKSIAFEKFLTVYRSLKDPYSTENDVRKLRSRISELYYEIYEKVFFKAEEDKEVDKVIELFLSYGFMDEKQFDKNQLVALYALSEKKYDIGIKVYTIREWLHAIYTGKKEPSKNEFDLNYEENFRELSKTQRFTDQQKKEYFADYKGKVRYEMTNMFKSNNRTTSGQLLTFCPVLSGKSFINDVEKMAFTPDKIEKNLMDIIDVDFSAFYREYQFEDADKKIPRMSLKTSVLPEFIVMPNVGQRGSMWQEIEGKKRVSPARFIVPAFTAENVQDIMLKLVGAFRWELCRTVQGIYWNDIRERSLTAEYCDYIQFFRKNRELSDEVKQKIKLQLQKSRNNNKEMFIKDYMLWVKNEAYGLARINKISRGILFMYCPFAKKYREKLAEHPMFTECMGRYERDRLKKLKELNNKIVAIKNNGGIITRELEENVRLLQDM